MQGVKPRGRKGNRFQRKSAWTDSPVHCQLQVRNADVIFSAVQQNLSLQYKQQHTESHEGQSEGVW